MLVLCLTLTSKSKWNLCSLENTHVNYISRGSGDSAMVLHRLFLHRTVWVSNCSAGARVTLKTGVQQKPMPRSGRFCFLKDYFYHVNGQELRLCFMNRWNKLLSIHFSLVHKVNSWGQLCFIFAVSLLLVDARQLICVCYENTKMSRKYLLLF